LISGPKSYRDFRETGPWSAYLKRDRKHNCYFTKSIRRNVKNVPSGLMCSFVYLAFRKRPLMPWHFTLLFGPNLLKKQQQNKTKQAWNFLNIFVHHFSSSEAILTRISLFPCLNKTKDRKENEYYLHNHDATVRSPDQTYQGHPATCFCKMIVRRSTYCLDISKAWERLKIAG